MPNPLDDILRVEPQDPGCGGGTVLDAYVDLELAGQDPASVYPGWAAHLRSCPGCHEDYLGLVEAVRLFGSGE